jgi:hypothetical protein
VKEESESSKVMSGVYAFLYSDVMSVCARVRACVRSSTHPRTDMLLY